MDRREEDLYATATTGFLVAFAYLLGKEPDGEVTKILRGIESERQFFLNEETSPDKPGG